MDNTGEEKKNCENANISGRWGTSKMSFNDDKKF